MNNLNIDKIYIHKNAFKTIKRNKNLFIEFKNFIQKINNISPKQIKIISNSHYRGRLSYKNRIIFDFLDNSILVYMIGNHDIYNKMDFSLKNYHNNINLDGFQIIELSKNNINKIPKIKHIELYLRNDSIQNEIIHNTTYIDNFHYGISGIAGSGKTTILNKLSYMFLKENKNFMYLTYNAKLKDYFFNLVKKYYEEENEDFSKARNKLNVYTFKEFIKNIIKNFNLNINLSYYVSDDDCKTIIMNIIENSKKDFSSLSFYPNEIAKLINSLFIDIDFNDNINDIQIKIQKKLERKNKGISYSEKDIKLLSYIIKEYYTILKKENRKPFYYLYNDIDISKLNFSEKYIFIDEMQDLSIIEFEFIKKIFKDNNLIFTYDINQNITYNDAKDRNVLNRVKGFNANDIKYFNLKYNYRNSYVINKFANLFADNIEFVNGNHNHIPVKIYIGDKNKLITILEKSIQEKQIFVGAITPYDYKIKNNNYIEYFTIDEVKGLEFTNVAILDFYYSTNKKKTIDDIDIKRWYVAITRAKENLLIHFNNIKEFEDFKRTFNIDDLIKENLIEIGNDKNIIDLFINDLVYEDTQEIENIKLLEAEKLFKEYEKYKDNTSLENALNLLIDINYIYYLEEKINLLDIPNDILENIIYNRIIKNDIRTVQNLMHIIPSNIIKNVFKKIISNLSHIEKFINIFADSEKIDYLFNIIFDDNINTNNSDYIFLKKHFIDLCTKYFQKTNDNIFLEYIAKTHEKFKDYENAIEYYFKIKDYKKVNNLSKKIKTVTHTLRDIIFKSYVKIENNKKIFEKYNELYNDNNILEKIKEIDNNKYKEIYNIFYLNELNEFLNDLKRRIK
ncbi:UvrD-helicase domain-containing protein [Marinitoga aeolica]|uniref:AAA family ATPase n=1 Tax=Marinitoga aeolica TaxID=2809031 RepID=A0ABY8PR86_9BACT|nr:UvrD-helicase domain-containing protein [Marinitoga aeolica]WGS65167.1 AAA family ATPase [Marinitoga aeolica]